jgi:hypothetical protein
MQEMPDGILINLIWDSRVGRAIRSQARGCAGTRLQMLISIAGCVTQLGSWHNYTFE